MHRSIWPKNLWTFNYLKILGVDLLKGLDVFIDHLRNRKNFIDDVTMNFK